MTTQSQLRKLHLDAGILPTIMLGNLLALRRNVGQGDRWLAIELTYLSSSLCPVECARAPNR